MKKLITKYKQKFNLIIICLITILMFQSILAFFWGMQKVGYHLDEIYTYELSNYSNTFVSWTKDFLETWKDGDFFTEALIPSEENRFNYKMVYQNQEKDVHPPLYYYVIHTITSLFAKGFSKWIGIIPNIVFCLLSTLALFGVSRRISSNDYIALVCTGLWAFSVGAMDTAIFIRMYAMLTFFSILLLWLHLKAFDETEMHGRISWITYIFLFLCTTSGILTQYYYLVFCFFLCGVFFVYMLLAKKWFDLLKYTVIEFGSIAVAVLYFPSMLIQIFGGYRGEEAFSNFANSENVIETILAVVSIIDGDLANGWGVGLICSLFFLALIVFINRHFIHIAIKRVENGISCGIDIHFAGKGKATITMDTVLLGAIGLVAIGYIVLIAKIAPYQIDRYYMCIYPLVSLMLVQLTYRVILWISRKESITSAIVILLFTFITGISYTMQNLSYVYDSYRDRLEDLLPYQNYPAIIINGASYNGAPDTWLYEYSNYSSVYRCRCSGDLSGLTQAIESKDLSGGFLLYAHYISKKDEELFSEIRKYIDIESYQEVTNAGCRVYYCTLHLQ